MVATSLTADPAEREAPLVDDPPAPKPALPWQDLAVAGLLALVTLAMYLTFVRRGGWYLDDWSFYASMSAERGHGFSGLMRGCENEITGGRSLACVYHAAVFDMFGSHKWLYHAWDAVMLWCMSVLGYAILRLAGAPRLLAAVAMVALVLYPSSDASRLWPVAAVGQYVMNVYLLGLLLGVLALRRTGGQAVALHVVSLACTVWALLTYEIVIPLVALNGLVYLAAGYHRGDGMRRSVVRGGVDFALAGSIGLVRVQASSTANVFVVKRTSDQMRERVELLIHRTWDVWHETFYPGTAGLLLLAVVLAGAVVAARTAASREDRRQLMALVAVFGLCGLVLVACAVSYLSANDYYVPDQQSTANRINLAGSLAGALGAAVILWLIVATARAARLTSLGRVVAVALGIGVALHLVHQSRQHQDRWIESARVTNAAAAAFPQAVRHVPPGAAILGFDTPQWEAGWVPVFETTWDLDGALRFTTRLRPSSARPAGEGTTCGRTGVEQAGRLILPYAGAAPIWAVSPARRTAAAIPNATACKRVFDRWGLAPFWGRTVTQPQLFS